MPRRPRNPLETLLQEGARVLGREVAGLLGDGFRVLTDARPAPVPVETPRTAACRLVGLDPAAPAFVVQAAKRAWVKAGHPDTGGDPERFKAIVAAFDVIEKGGG